MDLLAAGLGYPTAEGISYRRLEDDGKKAGGYIRQMEEGGDITVF